jgi:molybdopterin converting factor subunit 1
MRALMTAPITIKLLYFAALRDLTKCDEELCTLPSEVRDVAALRAWLDVHHETLRGRLNSVRFAVDEDFAADDVVLREGAVVALIPPVAGG